MASLRISVESLDFLKKHDDCLVVNLRGGIPFVVEALDEFPKGLSFLLHDFGQVTFNP
jgi:hypothetical protein